MRPERPEMTKLYSAHASIKDKRRGMERFSFFTQNALPEPKTDEPERNELRRLIDTLPIEPQPQQEQLESTITVDVWKWQ